MANFWFHRNPIKQSLEIDFSKRSFPTTSDSQMICTLLKQYRIQLLRLYANPANLVENVQNLFEQYISLLLGFITDFSGKTSDDSKLRFTIKSKWTQTLNPPYAL
jgi:hypothetical protein